MRKASLHTNYIDILVYFVYRMKSWSFQKLLEMYPKLKYKSYTSHKFKQKFLKPNTLTYYSLMMSEFDSYMLRNDDEEVFKVIVVYKSEKTL